MNADVASALRARLARLWQASSFWRRRFEQAGFASAPETLDRLPPVGASELALDEAEHGPAGTWREGREFVRAGVPVRAQPLDALLFTAADLRREAAAGARALRACGLEPGRRATNTLPGAIYTPGSLLVGDAVEASGCLDMPVGPIADAGPRATAWEFWGRVAPDFAIVDAAGARDLAALLAAQGTTAAGLGLGGVALVTDLRDRAAAPPPGFDVPVTCIAGLAECFGMMAARSPAGNHVPPPDEVVVEVLDGELLLTTLGHSAALIRYAPGVRARLAADGFEVV